MARSYPQLWVPLSVSALSTFSSSLITSSFHLHHYQRKIVVRRDVTAPLANALNDPLADILRVHKSRGVDDLLQHLLTELLVIGVSGFGNSVGVSHKQIAAFHLNCFLLIDAVVESPDDRSSLGQQLDIRSHPTGSKVLDADTGNLPTCSNRPRLDALISANKHRRVVPGIHVSQQTGTLVKLCVEECCVGARVGRDVKQAVHRRNEIGQISVHGGRLTPKRSLNRTHQQRRRNSFAGDVSNGDPDLS